ncbi:MAG: MBL fold metallo-hydrolase [Methanoregula sp.]|nr:MBL fold metallo-hydrolase [Methanoregula sp.]
MPGGNDTLTPLAWQPVPGADGARIYPLIRKIDTISSNSYLIATPDVLVLIDPGGLAGQAEQLAQVIGECRRERDRPVFVFLTHAHIDHFTGVLAVPAFASPETAVFAVQEQGAAALECGDPKLTQAELLGRTVPPMKIGLHLFPRSWEADAGIPAAAAFPCGATVTITYDTPAGSGGLPHARLEFGSGPALEVWHTPGHSPDSICLRMGGLFFTGDVLFAANPGIAGLCGWDQGALVQSLAGLLAVIDGGGITAVCPGHGRVVTAPEAARMLSAVRTDAQALSDIAELNRGRAEQAAAFAEDCMEQVNELFTIMAGRLYYVSYVMDELGESDIAERMGSLIPGDTIDELLEAFSAFAEEHHRGERISIHLALKAGQVMAKLERSFKKDDLTHIIDPTLVDRVGRLLSDYTVMLRGFNPPGVLSECPLDPLVEAIVTGLSVSSCSDEDLLSSADDDAAFMQILLSRIGTRPLLEDVAFSLDTEDRLLQVSVDRDHFTDLVTYILEDLVGTGSDTVTMQVRQEGRRALITITGNGATGVPAETPKKRSFLAGLCERAGGTLTCTEDVCMRRFVISLGLD